MMITPFTLTWKLWHFLQAFPVLLLILLLSLMSIDALDNGLGLVPPMGWNPWNTFHCNITEHDVIAAVDRMLVDYGLRDAGYTYINLDDCWMAPERGDDGRYTHDPHRFPSGMKALGDYIHAHGFQFGIYTSAGEHTCAGLPGSLGHEALDAMTFASWGVDYLKYDNCPNGQPTPNLYRYTAMRDALNATGRPIFYSLCNWGQDDSWRWAPAVGNSWRTTDDVWAQFKGVRKNFWLSQAHAFRSQPGAWLDPDLLEVGHPHLTFEQSKTNFCLWVLAKAPLLLSGLDVTMENGIAPAMLQLIRQHVLLAFHQDPTTQQAQCYLGCSVEEDFSILAAPWGDSAKIVLVVNWSDRDSTINEWSTAHVGIVPTKDEQVTVVDIFTTKSDNYTFATSQQVPVALGPFESAVYVLHGSAPTLGSNPILDLVRAAEAT